MGETSCDVFLSYKAEDRARLVPLVAALREEGFDVWWDADIGGGAHWREDIQNHLDAARCVIVAWSKRSVGPAGNFVRDEATRAQRRGVYLPVRIDAVEPPLGFGEVQALPLRGWKGDRSDARFRAVAEAVSRRLGVAARTPPPPFASPSVSRRTVIAGGAGAVALAAGGGWLLLKPTPASAKRIVVMPFSNLSRDTEQEYFSDGLAEELRGALSRVGLQVIGRTSSEAVVKEDTARIVERLGVTHILTGSVRRSPNLLRISTQLIDGKDGVETWAQNYDRAPGEVIAIQADIAEQVAQSLSVALGAIKRAIEIGGTANAEAQDLFQQSREIARKNLDQQTALQNIVALLDKALLLDPSYARALASRGNAKSIQATAYAANEQEMATGLADAEKDVRRAIEAAPSFGFAHAILGALASSRLDFRTAFRSVHHALTLAPHDPQVLISAGNDFPAIGPMDEARKVADALVTIDPLAATAWSTLSRVHLNAGKFDEAIEAGLRAAKLEQAHLPSALALSDAYIMTGKFDLALASLGKLDPADGFRLSQEARVAAASGRRDLAEQKLVPVRKNYGDLASYQFAQVHSAAGEIDQAIAALETAMKVKDPGLILIMRDPAFKPLRKDPRFLAIIKRLDFPFVDPM